MVVTTWPLESSGSGVRADSAIVTQPGPPGVSRPLGGHGRMPTEQPGGPAWEKAPRWHPRPRAPHSNNGGDLLCGSLGVFC